MRIMVLPCDCIGAEIGTATLEAVKAADTVTG